MLLTAIMLMSASAMAQGSLSSKNYKNLQEGLKYFLMAKDAQDKREKYFKYCKKSAELGHVWGMFSTALCYKEGDGTKCSRTIADELFNKTLNAIGTMKATPELYPEEFYKDNELYRPGAMYCTIGDIYGRSDAANECYEKGIEAGDAWAAYNLAKNYYYYRGRNSRYAEAANLFVVAVKSKYRAYEVCKYILDKNNGIFGSDRWENFFKNYPRAKYARDYAYMRINFENVKRLSENGNKDAQLKIAESQWLGNVGELIPQNKAAAVEVWKNYTTDPVVRGYLIAAHGEGIYKQPIPEEWYTNCSISKILENAGSLDGNNSEAKYAVAIHSDPKTRALMLCSSATYDNHAPSLLKLRELVDQGDRDALERYNVYAKDKNSEDQWYYKSLWKSGGKDNYKTIAAAMKAGKETGVSELEICRALASYSNNADDEFFPYVQRAAELGDDYSCEKLATTYQKNKNFNKALVWWNKKKEKSGNDWFQMYTCYTLLGKGQQAQSALRVSAAEGYTEARVILGLEGGKEKQTEKALDPNTIPIPRYDLGKIQRFSSNTGGYYRSVYTADGYTFTLAYFSYRPEGNRYSALDNENGYFYDTEYNAIAAAYVYTKYKLRRTIGCKNVQ